MFGVTVRGGKLGLGVCCGAIFILGLALEQRVGPVGWLFPGLVFVAAAVAARTVSVARDALWRAAQLPLDDPRQPALPVDPAVTLTPTAVALRGLGAVVDDVRRERYTAASEAMPRVDRALLRPEEIRLLEGSRAMISIGLGDTHTAAQLAVAALPTGSEDIDTRLGRAVISDAWKAPELLRAIEADWRARGITPDHEGTLGRLHRLTRLRIDERLLDGVGAAEARALSSEARAVGDEDFAADLEARARESAYR